MEKPNFFIGLAQLIIAVLLWLHIEPSWLGESLRLTRDGWILLFLCGGFAFTGFGLYRTYRPKITTRNIERKVREWLLAVQLPPQDYFFQQWHFTYVVIFRGVRIFVGRPRAMSGRFLQVEARITPIAADLAPTVAKMDNQSRIEFYRALGIEAAKTGILFYWNNANDISIIKWLSITEQLSDASIVDALIDVNLSAAVIWNTVRFWLDPLRAAESQAAMQRIESPATEAQTPPAPKEKEQKPTPPLSASETGAPQPKP